MTSKHCDLASASACRPSTSRACRPSTPKAFDYVNAYDAADEGAEGSVISVGLDTLTVQPARGGDRLVLRKSDFSGTIMPESEPDLPAEQFSFFVPHLNTTLGCGDSVEVEVNGSTSFVLVVGFVGAGADARLDCYVWEQLADFPGILISGLSLGHSITGVNLEHEYFLSDKRVSIRVADVTRDVWFCSSADFDSAAVTGLDNVHVGDLWQEGELLRRFSEQFFGVSMERDTQRAEVLRHRVAVADAVALALRSKKDKTTASVQVGRAWWLYI